MSTAGRQIVASLQGATTDSTILEQIKDSELDLSKDIPNPPPVLFQGDKVMMSKGDFSAVVGAAKSRKTFCITAMVGAYLSDDEYMGMSSPGDAGNVLWIDTEQSIYYAAKVARRICRIAGFNEHENNKRFRMLCLREFSPGTRFKMVDTAIRLYKPQLAIIDGAADLIEDVNDSAESSKLSTLLMNLTKELNNHIITVLHTNPGGDKPRGHLGTNFLNKAQALFIVKADGEVSTVSVERCRDIAVSDWAFKINDKGLPEITSMPEDTTKADTLKSVFYRFTTPIDRIKLRDAIMQQENIKKSMACRRIKEALTDNILLENKMGLLYYKKENEEEEHLPF